MRLVVLDTNVIVSAGISPAGPPAKIVAGLVLRRAVNIVTSPKVALIFYELLKPVSRRVALLAVFFRLVFVAIASANMLNHFAPLVLLSGTDALSAFRPEQLQGLALASLQLRTFGFDIALVFFGIHCVIIGFLLFRSTFFPRLLGVALATGGLGYLANIFATAMPRAVEAHLFPYIMLPAGIAEIALTLWLIIRGVNVGRWKEQASASGLCV